MDDRREEDSKRYGSMLTKTEFNDRDVDLTRGTG